VVVVGSGASVVALFFWWIPCSGVLCYLGRPGVSVNPVSRCVVAGSVNCVAPVVRVLLLWPCFSGGFRVRVCCVTPVSGVPARACRGFSGGFQGCGLFGGVELGAPDGEVVGLGEGFHAEGDEVVGASGESEDLFEAAAGEGGLFFAVLGPGVAAVF